MLWLGDWQLHRAESGNELSWAYTFEWPLFAIFCVYFWAKSLRDELRGQGNSGAASVTGPAADSADAALDPAAQAADADAYVERLKAEVRRHGGWHGWQ